MRTISSLLLALAVGLPLVGQVRAQQAVRYGDHPVQVAALYPGRPGAPALVWVTGTGWVVSSPVIARPFASALNTAGTTVLVPQYTPSAPETAVADVGRAVVFAASLPERGPLVLGGHSAGAQLAALAVLRDGVSVDGLLLVSGIYDLTGAVRDGGLTAQLVRQAFGQDAATWEARSPLTHARAGTPPIWIVHGARDTDVPPARALAFAERLKEAGAPVTWTSLPEANHVDAPLALLRHPDALLAFLREGAPLAEP